MCDAHAHLSSDREHDDREQPEVERSQCVRCRKWFGITDSMQWYQAWAAGAGWHCIPCYEAAKKADALTPERVIR